MPFKLYRRGKIWHYKGTISGRRLRETTGTADKAIAQRITAEAETAAWRSHLDGHGAHVTFAQAAIAYRAAGKCDRFLTPIEDHWKNTRIAEITSGLIRQCALKLYPNGSGATRNRQVLGPTQAVINHAADLEWCRPIRLKRFTVASKTKLPADEEWVLAFAEQAKSDGLLHLAALCLFMFGTGARCGEACALRWRDVDLFARKATIRQSKIEHERVSHLQHQLVVALANIPSNRGPDDLVFQDAGTGSIGQVWGNVVRRAGLNHLTPHSCRHGFATYLLRAGKDPKTVARLGGWKDVNTVMKFYAHANTDITQTDALFGTKLTQDSSEKHLTYRKKRNKS